MKLINYLIVAVTLVFAVSCDMFEEPVKYPVLTSLESTEWYSEGVNDEGKVVYYTLNLNSGGKGKLVGHDAKTNGNVVMDVEVTYIFKDPSVTMTFPDGTVYGGYLIQKGEIAIDYRDVYLIQLFRVDAEGNPVVDENNEYDSMLFWRE